VEISQGWGKGQQRQVLSSAASPVAGRQRLKLRLDQTWNITPFASGVVTKVKLLVPSIQLLSSEWGPGGNLNDGYFRPEDTNDQDKGYKFLHRYNYNEEVTAVPVGGTNDPAFEIHVDPTGGSVTPTDWIRPQPVGIEGTTKTARSGVDHTQSASTGLALNGGSLGVANDHQNRWIAVTGTDRTANGGYYNATVSCVAAVTGTIPAGSVLKDPTGKLATFVKVEGVEVHFAQPTGQFGSGVKLDLIPPDVNNFVTVDAVPNHSPAAAGGWVQFTYGETVTATGGGTGKFIEETDTGELILGTIVGTIADGDTLSGATAVRDGGTPILKSTDALYASHVEAIGNIYKLASHTSTVATLTDKLPNPLMSGLGFVPGSGLQYKVMTLTDVELQVTGKSGKAESLAIVLKDSKSSPAWTQTLITVDLTKYNTYQSLRDHLNESIWVLSRYGNGRAPNINPERFDFGQLADHWQANLAFGDGPGATYGQRSKYGIVRDNVQKVVGWLNQNHGRFTAVRATGGFDGGSAGYASSFGGAEPDTQTVHQQYYNGLSGDSIVRKASDTADPFYPISWAHGFEQLRTNDTIRVDIPCASTPRRGWATTDVETLLTDFKAHLDLCELERVYRNGYFGLSAPLESTATTTGLLEWVKKINQESMSLCGQEILETTTRGIPEWMPVWALGCKTAAMQLGSDLGEGFSLKHISADNIRSPLGDWEPTNRVQARKASLGGLLYVKPLRGSFRINRGYTTHVSSDNLARTDINVWEIRNDLTRGIQILIEDMFIGEGTGSRAEGVRFKARASPGSIRGEITTFLAEKRAEGIIVDSEINGKPILAYHSLSVKISGDIVRIKFGCFPKAALNFALVDMAFQLPQLSA